MRTVFAYLLAPWVAAIAVSVMTIPDGLHAAGQMLFISAYVSYLISWVVGTVVFLILRKMKKETIKHYFLTGAASGIVILLFFLASSSGGTLIESILSALYFAFLGGSVAMAFALIRGPKRSIQSELSTPFARPSLTPR